MDLSLDQIAQYGDVPITALILYWLYRVDTAVRKLSTAINTIIAGKVPANGDG